MKAWQIQGSFGIANLSETTVDLPEPGPGEILVKMKAASLNFRDYLMIEGKYNPRQRLPLVPLSDGAGVIEKTGPGVTRFKTGDRVMPCFAQGWIAGSPELSVLRNGSLGGPLDGTLREYMVVPENSAVEIPEHLDFRQAATLPCAALTAWSALVVYGKIRPGDLVVVLGTGGVSIFALQFAKMNGAQVVVTSGSDEKLEKARELGADYCINYNVKKDWAKEVRKITGNRGADHIIEVGGAGTLEQSIRATRMDGTISLIGILAGSGAGSEINLLPVLMQNIRIQGILVGHREGFEQMCRAISAHKTAPIVDKTFAFTEAKEAVRYLASAKHFGKIAIDI